MKGLLKIKGGIGIRHVVLRVKLVPSKSMFGVYLGFFNELKTKVFGKWLKICHNLRVENKPFKLSAPFKPSGQQPQVIGTIVDHLSSEFKSSDLAGA